VATAGCDSETGEVKYDSFAQTRAPADQSLIRLLKRDLEDREAEIIALTIERQATLTLLGKTEARRVVEVYGLSKTKEHQP